MAAISWKTAVNGDWGVASDWSTNTVPTSADTVTISVLGPYIVTISSADRASTLTFNASQAALFENAGSLMIGGALTVDSGFVSLNEANTIGGVAVAGGVLAFGNAGALGAGIVSMSGGELLATANETLGNDLNFSGTATIAAAHGMTLNEAGFNSIGGNSTLNFGGLGQDGVVIWNPNGFGINIPITFNVVAGTLRAGSALLAGEINTGAQPTTVDAGATLDTGGFDLTLSDLLGAGTVTDSGAAATLTLSGTNSANFSGVISGPLSLVADGSTFLSGANTYSGTTTINGFVQLGAGGATGSIGGGPITGSGALLIDRNNALTLTNAISGAVELQQVGTGVTSINAANSYTGGTFLDAGTLAIGNAGALGAGTISLSGGELLATANETLGNSLIFSGTSTIAAAHGTTLNENPSSLNVAASSTLNFGAVGQDGTILWHTPAASVFGSPFPAVNVQAGTFEGADSLFGLFLEDEAITVAAGATLDLAGNSASITNLTGGGTVVDSGAADALGLGAANFSGVIAGPQSVFFQGNASLSGLEDYTGGATLSGPVTVANTGTYDIVSNNGIAGTPASFFINNGLFEKTGGGGVSSVTSDFINNGLITVTSGSIQFSGGFANHGVIHGVVSQSNGVTTIRAGTPNDFNTDSVSDVLWRNTGDDSLVTWLMNGSAVASGTYVTSQGSGIAPDSSWSVAGIGDFNGDGDADVLWRQSTTGTVVDWSMNGSVVETGTELTYQGTALAPDSSWSVAGVGDFNGDGAADILWRQSTTGSLVTWLMNGSTISSDTDVTLGGSAVAPDSTWSVAGIGDFNGDGSSDILWRQSTTGTLTEWQMNGAQIASSNFVMSQGSPITPDSTWSVVGIGDFNGDGNADILWRQSTTGALVDWSMSGPTVQTGVELTYQGNALTPDSTWNVVEVGDFNGTKQAGILWQQSTTGSLVEWQMNGAQIISSNFVTSQGNTIAPPSSFQVQATPTDFV